MRNSTPGPAGNSGSAKPRRKSRRRSWRRPSARRRRPLRRPGKPPQAKYEARKARIGKAYQASKEKGLADIENQTGTRKYELQKRMLQAERDRDAGLAAAATALEEFKANLAAEQAALAPLETAAHKRFQGLPEVRPPPVGRLPKGRPARRRAG